MKREDYISWDDFFMGVALLASQRSKDPRTQVGACIINNDKKIVGVGYNGFPNGCSDDEFSWDKPEAYGYIVHSEINAICNCLDRSELKNSIMYVTLFPCNECAKLIIQSGISKLYYLSEYRIAESAAVSRKMFDAAKVSYEKFIPKKETIEINFK